MRHQCVSSNRIDYVNFCLFLPRNTLYDFGHSIEKCLLAICLWNDWKKKNIEWNKKKQTEMPTDQYWRMVMMFSWSLHLPISLSFALQFVDKQCLNGHSIARSPFLTWLNMVSRTFGCDALMTHMKHFNESSNCLIVQCTHINIQD